jgi:NitT/TauT family transport system ATP-binding protein
MILVSHDLEEAVYLADRILLLTKRPTRVAETVPFNAPRMRDSHTLSSEEFIRIKAQCLEIFQREVRR